MNHLNSIPTAINGDLRAGLVVQGLIICSGLERIIIIWMQPEVQRQDIYIPDDLSVIEQKIEDDPEKDDTSCMVRDHQYGGLHINYLLYFFIPLLIGACVITYHVAVSKKEEPPFPHSTITNTACHYPQDILFRYLMLPAGGFINLVYYCIFRWMSKEKKRIGYTGSIYGWMLPLGQMSTLGFLAAIGTIDGDGYPIIHDIGAVFFFIILFFLATIITLVIRDMHDWDPSAIPRSSYLSKTLFAGYLVGMVLYCVIDGLKQLNPKDGDDPVVVILEWNLVFFGLAWLFTFKFDWTHVFITLKGDFSSSFKRIAADS